MWWVTIYGLRSVSWPNAVQRASPKGLLCGSCIQIRLEDGGVVTPSDSEVLVGSWP